MSEEPESEIVLAAPKAKLADIETARYLRLLFHGGSNAWVHEVSTLGDNYILKIDAPKGKSFTIDDHHACRAIFKDQFGITLDRYRTAGHAGYMDFVLTAYEWESLKDRGLGRSDIGSLLQKEMVPHPRPAVVNDAHAVLAHKLRLNVLDSDGWVLPERNRLLGRVARETRVLTFDNAFLKRLLEGCPADADRRYQLGNEIYPLVHELLPDAHVELGLTTYPDGIGVRLYVDKQNFPQVQRAIMQAQQLPKTNITDFDLAAERLGVTPRDRYEDR